MLGWNSSPFLIPSDGDAESGDWLICILRPGSRLEDVDVVEVCGEDDVGVIGEESGIWFIPTPDGASTSSFGVLKAPVLFFCSFSNSSWSSFGRRGGAGPEPNGFCACRTVAVVNVRRGRRRRVRSGVGIVVW
jgi:hypothetical protein